MTTELLPARPTQAGAQLPAPCAHTHTRGPGGETRRDGAPGRAEPAVPVMQPKYLGLCLRLHRVVPSRTQTLSGETARHWGGNRRPLAPRIPHDVLIAS